MDSTFMWEKEALEILEYFWEWICISLRWDTWDSPDLPVFSLSETPVDSLEVQQNTSLERKKYLSFFARGLERGNFYQTCSNVSTYRTALWVTYHTTWGVMIYKDYIPCCQGFGSYDVMLDFHNTYQKGKRFYGFSFILPITAKGGGKKEEKRYCQIKFTTSSWKGWFSRG